VHSEAAINGRLGYSAAFGFVLAANVLFFLSFQSTFPVLPRYIADVVLNLPPDAVGGQVGLATTVLALVAVFTRIPSGQMADRFGDRRFMLFGAVCFALAPLVYAVSRGLPVLLVGRVIQGLGLATFSTASVALGTKLAPESRRGEALGLLGASTSIALIFAPPLGDWAAANWGYTPTFMMSAATAGASIVFVALTYLPSWRESAESVPVDTQSPTTISGLWQALGKTGVRAGALIMAALGIAFGAFITFLPLFAEERNVQGAGLVFSAYAITVFVTQPLAGRLTDHVGRLRTVLPGLIIAGLAVCVLAFDGSFGRFLLAGAIFGFGGGLVRGGVDPLVQDSVPHTLRGTAAAVQYTSFDFWIGVGSLPVGLLANAVGYAVTYVVTGIFCWLGAGALVAMLRRDRGDLDAAGPPAPS
jgi:MFS family permease